MANFSQLRRRQSSREILYRSQISEEFDERRRHRSVSGSRPNANVPPSARYSHWINEGPEENEEISSLMWEMRPRYATSAGELKRQRNRDREVTICIFAGRYDDGQWAPWIKAFHLKVKTDCYQKDNNQFGVLLLCQSFLRSRFLAIEIHYTRFKSIPKANSFFS